MNVFETLFIAAVIQAVMEPQPYMDWSTVRALTQVSTAIGFRWGYSWSHCSRPDPFSVPCVIEYDE